MNATTWALLGLTVAIALVDWYAVATENLKLEYVAKPAVMLPLIGATLTIDPSVPAMRGWFVGAVVFSLAGDVFLMLPDPRRFFIPGLASFLVGHVLYIIGFTRADLSGMGLLVGGIVAFVALAAVGPTIVKGSQEVDRVLPGPVLVYILTISVMVTCAIGSGSWVAIVGALLFYVSDFCIGWSRFVQGFRLERMAIITTYHVAQILLGASLATIS